MFNAYIKSKLEYCGIVWSPVEQNSIYEMEDIQKIFTRKIEGMEGLDYHERLKKLKMYSLERKRDRYLIIYGWQQVENIKENVLKLELSERYINRRIKQGHTPGYGTERVGTERVRILRATQTKIHHCPARKIERAFNCMPSELRNISGVKTETFKKHLDKWLSGVPDQPRGGGYAERVAANSNSIQVQCQTNMACGEPVNA